VVREGTNLTIVSVSRMVQEALAAAEALAPGDQRRVLDLRTVAPLDKEPSWRPETNRLLIAHEGVTDFGIGAEIGALAGPGVLTLERAVMRVAPPPRVPLRAEPGRSSGCPTAVHREGGEALVPRLTEAAPVLTDLIDYPNGCG